MNAYVMIKIGTPILALAVAGTMVQQQRLTVQERILTGAKRQTENPAQYTPGYFKLKYPSGDLPPSKGVCTDVVIRSLRHAGYDLQRLIHEDMGKRFSTYPRRGSSRDRNIDHRRVPNQIHYFRKFASELPLAVKPGVWKPGDLVYWKLPNGLDHCGVVSDRLNSKGLPYVIHNIWQTAEEDVLSSWKVVAHFRFPKKRP